MGNQPSQPNAKESWLTKWSPEEQKRLHAQFENLLRVSTTETLPGFQSELVACLTSPYAKQKDFEGYVKVAFKVKSTDETCAEVVRDTFLYAVLHFAASLQDLVEWVVQAGLPIWFKGSQMTEDNDALGHNGAHDNASRVLTDFLLRRAKEEQRRNNQRQADDLCFLQDNSPQKGGGEIDIASWLNQAATKPSTLSSHDIVQWALATPSFLVLFRLCVEALFLGAYIPLTDEDVHRRRVMHQLAPAIKHPRGEAFSRLLTAYDYFILTFYLPADALSWSSHEQAQRRVNKDVAHERLFSSQLDGTSWQVFVNKVRDRGATLIVIRAKDGTLFGGYADEVWTPATGWYGNASNFLFRLRHQEAGPDVWEGLTGGNDHYQYLCWGKKSLPNGLGMGGQFDYAGLWLDSDFTNGHSRAGPVCSTFGSPQLTTETTFVVDEVEAWLVKPLKRDDDGDEGEGPKSSALSRAEDMEFLEMAGKKMYSRDLGQPEEREEADS